MHIKHVEKVSQLFERLKTLDAQIIQLDRIGFLIADGDTELNLTLLCVDLRKKAEEEATKKKEGTYAGLGNPWMLGIYSHREETPESSNVYQHGLTEEAALHLVHVLVWQLSCERNNIIKELQTIGVKI